MTCHRYPVLKGVGELNVDGFGYVEHGFISSTKGAAGIKDITAARRAPVTAIALASSTFFRPLEIGPAIGRNQTVPVTSAAALALPSLLLAEPFGYGEVHETTPRGMPKSATQPAE